MDKEELLHQFNKNVEWLRNNVPPDDIYLFTEQTFMASLFFLHKWSEHEDLNIACEEDPIARKWIRNIMGLVRCRDLGLNIQLDLNMESIEE